MASIKTTDPLQALLYINEPGYEYARWNYNTIDTGTACVPNQPGQPVLITYSFLNAVPEYYFDANSPLDATALSNTFEPMTLEQQEAIRGVLRSIEGLIGVQFVELYQNVGEITFGRYEFSDGNGKGLTPTPGDTANEYGSSGGDVWFSTSDYLGTKKVTPWGEGNLAPGSDDYLTIWHEIGHALGLKHTANENGADANGNPKPLPPEKEWKYILDTDVLGDNHETSVMSYHHSHSGFPWLGKECGLPFANDEPAQFTAFDLQALRYLYGYPTSVTGNNNTVIIGGPGVGTLQGSSGNNILRGGAGNDALYGYGGDDVLDGGPGADILDGGAGNDTLTGGRDYDIFVFSTALNASTNVDTIIDFNCECFVSDVWGGLIDNPGGDRINLSSTIFSRLPRPTGSDTRLQAGNFRAGANVVAADTDDYILYDTSTGALYYDADGNGAGAAVKFAILSNKPGLSSTSFFIDTLPILTLNGTDGNDTLHNTFARKSNNWLGMGVNINGLAGNDIIFGSPYDDILQGNEGDDTLRGYEGNDTLYGGDGNDTLYGDGSRGVTNIYNGRYDLMGNDTLYGGAGDDTLYGDEGSDTLYGGLGNDWVNGGNGDDTLYGEDGDDNLSGGAGNDTLQGGTGIDKLDGGDGNDSLYGGDGDDNLRGGGGADKLYGGAGNDYLCGDGGNDILDGGDGNDILAGNGWATNEKDSLTGGLGADTFRVYHYRDSDTGTNWYGLPTITDFHPSEGDKIDTNMGMDKIYDKNFRAGVNVRALDSDDYFLYDTSTGALYYDEDGNGAKAAVQFATLANKPNLSAADFLQYVPEAAKPQVITGTPKNDILTGDAANDTINGLAGNDILYGGAGNDILYGGPGDDCLDGQLYANVSYKVADWNAGLLLRSGADTMYGGAGNDYYFVDNTGDKVIEYAGQGYDRVYASISYTLPGYVEFLWLQGSANLNGTGNNLDNYMVGNSGANTLNGGAGNDTLVGQDGNDTLWGANGNDMLSGDGGNDILNGGAGNDWLRGGAGNDILTGGAGSDRFVFQSVLTNGRDTISDFQSGFDRVMLGGLPGALTTEMRQRGSLPAYRFAANNTGVATNANQRIIYNLKTGALYYDADGSGQGAAVQFATLSNKPANLKAGDFFAMAS